MRILTIDVGHGTIDILLYDDQKTFENSIQLVFPSVPHRFAQIVETSNKNIFLYGHIMGGDPLAGRLYRAVKKGRMVVATPRAAMSFRYNIAEVEQKGVIIDENGTTEKYPDFLHLKTRDIEFEVLDRFFSHLDEKWKDTVDIIALAVQDHGKNRPGESARVVRINEYKKRLKNPFVTELAYMDTAPDIFPRFQENIDLTRSYYEKWEKIPIMVMDSSPAVIAGVLSDLQISPTKNAVIVNVGNGHTLGFLLNSKKEVLALFEHHTGLLTQRKLEQLITDLMSGNINNETILNDKGHGALVFKQEECNPQKVEKIYVIGPKRNLLANSSLNIEFPAPLGAMMLAGPIGLLYTLAEKWGESFNFRFNANKVKK